MDLVKISIDRSSSDGLLPALNEFQKLCCINANMVALCRSEDDLLEWIGYGKLLNYITSVKRVVSFSIHVFTCSTDRVTPYNLIKLFLLCAIALPCFFCIKNWKEKVKLVKKFSVILIYREQE